MAGNLRERLRRIREAQGAVPRPGPAGIGRREPDGSANQFRGWVSAGFQTLKRVLDTAPPLPFPAALPAALPVLVPDLDAARSLPVPEELLFFDLETTGLSGGAGTVAFLAAFGRLARTAHAPASGGYSLRITQYLLLDYPGENDFIGALVGEFAAGPPVAVSYNGKSFDSQIIKTRCLMNGFTPPEYRHADLLHPARRLWKKTAGGCSQGTIETAVLGIDRSGDTPGALAPEIWFSFLRSGGAEALMGVCDHNLRDIAGLAAIFAAMCDIASDPLGALPKYRYDLERLALRWRDRARRAGELSPPESGPGTLRDTAGELLRFAAKQGCPAAALVYARDLLRSGGYDEGRRLLAAAAEAGVPPEIRAAALRALAIDSEWRLGNAVEALELTRRALELPPPGKSDLRDFRQRAERLAGKTGGPFLKKPV
ncbi:MAG: ribonuclease H-like domain-containing protein [Spirochaetaceae bacterium]|jgi:uncharacterized protein YprB with RNaseH-like and TPR domain|nr:ribonuclease H-like domain-containing protein [Spirochaetaceae bacterium]